MKVHTLIVLITLVASAIGRAQELPPTCDRDDPPSCLYISDLSFPIASVQLTRLDPSRGNYPVPLLIRYPIGATGPRPVVIWHHGGNPHPNGRTRSTEWGRALAEAGYVVIHPSRVTIADARPFEAECRVNGFSTPEECAYWVTQFRYGPLTTTFLIDTLNQLMLDVPALRGRIDVSKIVVGGHSAGSTGPLANAGAWQQWVAGAGAPKYFTVDARPLAFIASGPQGPVYAGFRSGFQAAPFDGNKRSSYAGIGRPFMFITGVGDETQEPPEARVTAWLSALPVGKVLSWDLEPEAVHETMDIHKCDTNLRAKHCAWIESAGIAFLDAIVRQRPEAREWVASEAYEVLTEGAIELHTR